MWIAGGNANVVRNNHFYDNWRRGAMLFQVPDQFVCDDPDNQVAGCDPKATVPATSYRNRFYSNKMGVAPNGRVQRNGVDFWWDQGGISVAPTLNTGNCWYGNTGPDGTTASVTGTPSPGGTPPNNLPSNCAASPSVGAMNGQTAEELTCSTVPKGDPTCPWFTTPPKPDVARDVGQPIGLADCNDWNRASTDQRLGTITQLKGFAGGPIVGNSASAPSGTGAVLDDQDAYSLFDRWCGHSFARAFKLYKIYERAAGLTGRPAH
jgi:hypothetical protein